ncbi:MAG: peptidylprolyl isomerase [Bacteroidetes bacterium]|nr:MAG: peptidylprolyl isomerase [Bacteroidota bacterium]
MKKIILVAIAAFMISSCSESESKQIDTSNATELATELDSVSYLLGINFGTDINKNSGLKKLDNKSFLTGIQRVFDGKENEISDEDANTFMRAYFAKLQKAKVALDLAKNDSFLAANRAIEGVKVTQSGLQYRVITEGHGAIPEVGDTVKVHYTGKFMDGKVFDSSVERGEPMDIKNNQVIKGWTEALTMMPVGSKWELVIPSDLAYGERGSGRIPANAALIFEVELLDFTKE